DDRCVERKAGQSMNEPQLRQQTRVARRLRSGSIVARAIPQIASAVAQRLPAFVFRSIRQFVDRPTKWCPRIQPPENVGAGVADDQLVVEIRNGEPHRIANAVNEQLARRYVRQALGYFRASALVGDVGVLDEAGAKVFVSVENLTLIFGEEPALALCLD